MLYEDMHKPFQMEKVVSPLYRELDAHKTIARLNFSEQDLTEFIRTLLKFGELDVHTVNVESEEGLYRVADYKVDARLGVYITPRAVFADPSSDRATDLRRHVVDDTPFLSPGAVERTSQKVLSALRKGVQLTDVEPLSRPVALADVLLISANAEGIFMQPDYYSISKMYVPLQYQFYQDFAYAEDEGRYLTHLAMNVVSAIEKSMATK